jgi:enoyl-CoA hydratase
MYEKHFGDILYQREQDVAVLTINRPQKLNSMTANGLADLRNAIEESDSEKESKVIVLTGSGSRAFSAGFDILSVPDLQTADSRLLHINNQKMYRAFMGMNKVTVAAVNGMALGTGFEISLLCDFTVAAESATFGMPELLVGAYPGVISVTLLWELVGKKKSCELLLAGKTLTAEEAAALGLVNEVVPDEALMDRSLELANQLAKSAPLPVAMVKARMNSMLRMALEEEMSRFVEAQTLIFESRDFKEGLDALKEKRKPVFRGE